MAITAPRSTSDFDGFLNPSQSAPIFEDAARQSVVQRLARQVPLGYNGQSIPIRTSKPTANWVDEGGRKPSTEGGRGLLPMVPKKLAAIVVNSMEVVRANPGGYISDLRGDLAEAFAVAFDYAALYGVGGDGTGSGPFDNYLDETSKRVTFGTAEQDEGGIHADIVAGLELLVADTKRLTGFAFDDIAEPMFLGAVDTHGRPIYIDTPLDDTTRARNGRLIGRESWMGEGLTNDTTVGFGGDFRKVAWGVVGGISYRTSVDGTVTIDGELVSLFENNLIAVLAEAEYGLVVADTEAFVAYEAGS
jgi:HK97 family phage major capsid protein